MMMATDPGNGHNPDSSNPSLVCLRDQTRTALVLVARREPPRDKSMRELPVCPGEPQRPVRLYGLKQEYGRYWIQTRGRRCVRPIDQVGRYLHSDLNNTIYYERWPPTSKVQYEELTIMSVY